MINRNPIEPTHYTEEIICGKKEVLGHFNETDAVQWAQGGEDVKLFIVEEGVLKQISYEHKRNQCGIVIEEDVRFASANKPSDWAII